MLLLAITSIPPIIHVLAQPSLITMPMISWAWEKHMRIGVIYADKHIISCKKVTLTAHVISAYTPPRYKKTKGSQTPNTFIIRNVYQYNSWFLMHMIGKL